MSRYIKKLFGNPFIQIITAISIVMVIGGWFISRLEGTAEITQGVNPFWWAIVTMATVGYGDFSPISTGGRVLAIIIMFGGISLTALLTATISSIFVAKKIREDKGLEKVTLKDHIILCGWNMTADRILESLQNIKGEGKLEIVLINDEEEDSISSIRNKHRTIEIKFVRGDFTQEAVLERANLNHASTVILSSDATRGGSHADEKVIFGTLTIKTMASHVRVVAYIINRDNLTHIKRANADEVILQGEFGAYMVASHILDPGVPQTIEILLNSKTPSQFRRVEVPSEFIGKMYSELFNHLKEEHGWLLVSVFSEEEQIGIGEVLSSDTSALDAFIERKLKEAGHSLDEENKISVMVNPKQDYLVKEGEKAIVIL